MEPASDSQIIASSVTDPEAFGVIFDRHAAEVLRFLGRQAGDDGGGLLGEVFRVAFERRGAYDPARSGAAPWLLGIARNLCRQRRRKQGRGARAQARLSDARPEPAGEDAAIAIVDARAQLPAVTARIVRLPPGERDALILRIWEELEYADIAARLQIPVGTVRSRLNRARRRLREPDRDSGQEHDREALAAFAALLAREKERLMARIEQPGESEYLNQGIVPQMPYEDIAAAVAFLTQAFGFTERQHARLCTSDGRPIRAEVRVGTSVIMLGGQGSHGVVTPRSSGSASQLLSVYVDDVDAHFERARKHGARVIEAPTDKFWGDRVYEVEDCAGHRWRFHQFTGKTFEWHPE